MLRSRVYVEDKKNERMTEMHNYQMTNGTRASEVILSLNPDLTLHIAHIVTVYDLCRNGMSYSNQDGDVLGAAASVTGKWDVADYAAKWVSTQCARRAELDAALAWAFRAECAVAA